MTDETANGRKFGVEDRTAEVEAEQEAELRRVVAVEERRKTKQRTKADEEKQRQEAYERYKKLSWDESRLMRDLESLKGDEEDHPDMRQDAACSVQDRLADMFGYAEGDKADHRSLAGIRTQMQRKAADISRLRDEMNVLDKAYGFSEEAKKAAQKKKDREAKRSKKKNRANG